MSLTNPDAPSLEIIPGFVRPFGLEFDALGRLYVADLGANAVHRFTPDLKFECTIGCAAFHGPHSVGIDRAGYLYITEYYGKRLQRISPDLKSSEILLQNGHLPFGWLLQGPATGTVTSNDEILVSDFGSNSIQKFSLQGEFLGWLGRRTDGEISEWDVEGEPNVSEQLGGLNRPHKVVSDSQGCLYVADTWNHRIVKYNQAGKALGSIGYDKTTQTLTSNFKLSVTAEGSAIAGGLHSPTSLALCDEEAFFVVCEYGNSRVQRFSLDGAFQSGFAGRSDGSQLHHPYDVKVHENQLFICDTDNSRILVVRGYR